MYGMEVYSEDGYKVFTTNGKIYYTLLGKCVARRLSNRTAPSGMYAWHIIFPSYVISNPDKYIMVLKITNNPVRPLERIGGVSRPPPGGIEFFATTAPEMYVYTREPIQGSADYGLNTFNAAGELEFSSGRGNQILQIEAAYQTIMSMTSGSSWTSGLMGDGVILTSLPFKLDAPVGELYSGSIWESELKLVNGRVAVTIQYSRVTGVVAVKNANSRLALAVTKLPTWTVPTISW